MINNSAVKQPFSAGLEQKRLALLDSLGLLDSPPEAEFDSIVHLAQRLTGCKIAVVSLVTRDRQWFKAKVGLEEQQTSREVAFCAHTIAADDVLIIPDAHQDRRFVNNPLVTGGPRIRFYAGVPIRMALPDFDPIRVPLGSLCVIDDQPRHLEAGDIKQLESLAQLVESLIAAKSSAALALRLSAERGQHLQLMDRVNRQLRQAERMANIGSWRLDLETNEAHWSEQTYIIHGVPPGDGTPLDAALEFYPPKARIMITTAMERTIRTGEPFDVETDFVNAQGSYRRVRSMGELEVDNGKPVALIGVFQDITERYKMEELLRKAANTDELTKIASRGFFNEFVDDRMRTRSSELDRCALLLIDLDHFKAVNDKLGHHAGDDTLRAIAARLRAPYLSQCLAARLGGDEFVLLVTDPEILRDLPGLLRRLLDELQYSVSGNGETFQVSATIGASWLDAAVSNRSDLLRRADEALYEAKRLQRGSAKIAGYSELIVKDEGDLAVLRLVKN